MSELPVGWTQAHLAQLAVKVGSGATPRGGANVYKATGTPLIRSMNVIFFGFKKDGLAFLDDQQAADLAGASVVGGDVLLNITGASIGRVTVAPPEMTGARVNQHVCIVRPSGAINAQLLSAYLSTAEVQSQIAGDQYGMTRQALTKQQVLAMEIPVPPMPEQTRIADKLDKLLARVDACRDRLATAASLIKRFRQSAIESAMRGELTEKWRDAQQQAEDAEQLLAQLCDDHVAAGGHQRGNASAPTDGAHDLDQVNLPAGWTVVTLRDACEPGRPITYGILKPGPELVDGVPYVRVADFPGNRLKLDSIKKTSAEIDEQFKRARLKAGDLLLSIRGSVGRLIEIPAVLENANITQDTARLSLSPRINRRFVYYALLSEGVQRRMNAAVRGVAVRGINIGDVRALQLPLPGIREQQEIVRSLDGIFKRADGLDSHLSICRSAANRLTSAVLAKAFRGELVPQDPADEPADVMLQCLGAGEAPEATARRRRRPTTA